MDDKGDNEIYDGEANLEETKQIEESPKSKQKPNSMQLEEGVGSNRRM